MNRNSVNRRSLIRATGAAGIAASLAPRITFASQEDSAPLPTAAAAADENGYYPSGVAGVNDAYTKVPAPFAATDGPPGNGGSVKALVMTYSAPPPGKDNNQYWQELDNRLGVSWEPILVPNSTYGEKATAIIASGDFPDLFYLNYNQTISPLANFVDQGAFIDLTPYVTGDAIKEYPNLATFPDFMWEATKLNGKIYGVPCPSGRSGQIPFIRRDWADKLAGGIPTNADETVALFDGMSNGDPDGNGNADTWAMGRYGTTWDNGLINCMFRVPNQWRVNDDGSFTNQIETEEYRMAVEFMRKLYEGKAYHPDSAAMQFEQALQLFQSGRTGLHVDGGSVYGRNGYNQTVRQYQPEAVVEYLLPYGYDGQPGVTYSLPGLFGFTAIPITVKDEDRIHELLRIFNWLSSPFGSEEWLFKNYGIEGVHFDYDENGTPFRNEVYDQENGGLTGYIGGSLQVNFVDTDPSVGPVMTDIQKATYEIGIDNPAANLFSPAAIKTSPITNELVADALTSIITGRDDISSLDSMISNWKSRGGDDVRKEFEAAYAANQG